MNFWGAILCDCTLGAGDTICMPQACFLPSPGLPLQLSLRLSIPSSERMGWGRKCGIQRVDSVSSPSLNKGFRDGWDWMKLLCVNFYNRLLTVLLFSFSLYFFYPFSVLPFQWLYGQSFDEHIPTQPKIFHWSLLFLGGGEEFSWVLGWGTMKIPELNVKYKNVCECVCHCTFIFP